MTNTFTVIESEEQYAETVGIDLARRLADHAFDVDEAIVVDGDVDTTSLSAFCRSARRMVARNDLHSFIFRGDLTIRGRAELDGLQLVALRTMCCESFVEDSYHYGYVCDLQAARYAVFNRTSGCIIVDNLAAPLLFVSENYPAVAKLTSTVVVTDSTDVTFLRQKVDGRTVLLSSDYAALTKTFVEQFQLDEDSSVEDVFYNRRSEILRYLDESDDCVTAVVRSPQSV